MNRSTIALLLSLLAVSAPLPAHAAAPVEDPRKCLFDEAPAAERAKAAEVEKRLHRQYAIFRCEGGHHENVVVAGEMTP